MCELGRRCMCELGRRRCMCELGRKCAGGDMGTIGIEICPPCFAAQPPPQPNPAALCP